MGTHISLNEISEDVYERIIVASNDGQGDTSMDTLKEIKSWAKRDDNKDLTPDELYDYVFEMVEGDANMIDFMLIEDNKPIGIWLVK